MPLECTANLSSFEGSPEGTLRNHVDASIASGVMHRLVEQVFDRIRGTPVTEERGEEPHARMAGERTRALAALKGWHAATARQSEWL